MSNRLTQGTRWRCAAWGLTLALVTLSPTGVLAQAAEASAPAVEAAQPTVAETPAAAQPPAADAPVAQPEAASEEGAALAASSSSATLVDERPDFLVHFGVTAAAGVLAVPAGLFASAFLGSLSIDLIWTAVPVLLTLGLLAPALTTLVAWLGGNWFEKGRFGYWLPFAAAALVNVLALVVGGFAGVTVGVPLRLIAFSLIDGALMAGASVGTMRFFEGRGKTAPPPTVASFVPGVSPTLLVPAVEVSF